MTGKRWCEVEVLFHSALERSISERAGFIAQACAGDEQLRLEIESLIRAHDSAEHFIEAPALALAAEAYHRDSQESFIGQRIGRYEIVGLLGAGGMGEVYRGKDAVLNRDVAIKILPPDFDDDPDAQTRFVREAQAVAALSHPNILALHDFGFERGVHFAVMELLEGETLASRLRQGPMGWRDAARAGVSIADGLAAAHAKGTIHRDLKPENIFLTADGQVKILDFGIAHVRHRRQASSEGTASTETRFTAPGVVMGTPLYMSPEQLRGESAEASTDIFSFGCVLYEMVTGHRPFARGTMAETIAAMLDGNVPPMAETLPDAPVEFEHLICACLRPHAKDRLQSAHELACEMRGIVNDFQKNAYSPVHATMRTRWFAVAIALAILILAAAIWHLRSPARTAVAESLAVLPFLNESGDPKLEYLADGIAEGLINSLSQAPELKVIARSTAFRYKGRQVDPRKAGQELKVRRVFTGRLVQYAGAVSVQVDLINVRDGMEVWGERYNEALMNAPAFPEQISGRISESLKLRLSGPERRRLTKPYTENREAHRLYLMGRYFWSKRTEESLRRSIEYFQQAIEKDPAYALAYAGLADSYSVLPTYASVPGRESQIKAKAAALKALDIDGALAEPHVTLASLSQDEWNWPEAEIRFKRAIDLNPGYATAHQWYGECLERMARVPEALVEVRKAYELDPFSLSVNTELGALLYDSSEYDQANEQFKRTLELAPNFVPAQVHLALSLLQQKKFDAAATQLNTAKKLTGGAPAVVAVLGCVYAQSGRRQRALEILRELTGPSKQRTSAFDLAALYFTLGDKDRAFEFLNAACERREPLITLLKVDPFFAPLRSDPRCKSLLRRMRLAP